MLFSVYGAKDESLNMRKIKDRIAKTSIVTYKKAFTSEKNVFAFLNDLENDSGLKVKHLPNLGAFLITYNEIERMRSKKRILFKMVNRYQMTFDEDAFVTFPEDPRLRNGDGGEFDIPVYDEPVEELLLPDLPNELVKKLPNDRNLDPTIPPDDTHFQVQWALHKLSNKADINAQEGWTEFLSHTNAAKEVIVAVIDTGVRYDHEDLRDVMWHNPGEVAGNVVDDDNNGIVDDVHGADFFGDFGDPIDNDGHGTHCAGIIAAKENSGRGIAGVASYTNGKVYTIQF